MSDRLFIGIDNGISGAYAALTQDGLVVELAPLPVTKIKTATVLDVTVFKTILSELCSNKRPHILIESAQKFSRGKNALTSTWMCYGSLWTILEISGYAWEPVSPKKWQQAMFAEHVRTKDQSSKQASIYVAKHLFPETRLTRTEKSKKPDSGMADALLIAEYARRKR